MSKTNFVFFRYPYSEAQMIVEDQSGSEAFTFMDFGQNHPVQIVGQLKAYDPDWKIDVLSQKREPQVINKTTYLSQVDKYLQVFKTQDIRKTILSRVIKEELYTNDVHVIFQDLCAAYPDAMIYMAKLDPYGIWAGASPERLLQYENGLARTVALAGTKTTSDPADWGQKERNEHREVEKYIEILCEDERFHLLSKTPVYIKQAGEVYHLKSDFVCSVGEDDIRDFLNHLHPTPAVCGTPLEASKKLIFDTESHDRSFYTGYMGLAPSGLSKSSSFEFYVNLRCFQIVGSTAYLYVGGGITAESKAESEWQETIDKSRTILSILEGVGI